jgi:3-oxoadipate enol-lactonase
MEMIVNGVRLNYDDRGAGEAILLMHGFPLDRSMWEAQVEALASDYRVITPDLRGFGASAFGDANPRSLSLDLYAADMAAMLDALHIDRVTLGGFSMGGYAAFPFLRAAAPRVARLLLIDTKATPDTPEARENRFALMERVARDGAKAAAAATMPRMFATTEAEAPELWARTRAIMEGASTPGTIGALHALATRPDSTPDLAAIDIPTLVIVGADDVLTPPNEAHTMHGLIRHSEIAQIPHCGHLSPMEQPAAVNDAIRAFLSR